jgi:hypothetical protein
MTSSDIVDEKKASGGSQIRIPMSVGPIFEDVDTRGSKCLVVDVIVAPAVIQESITDATFRYELVSLISKTLEQKHSLTLEASAPWKLLNLRYKGEAIRHQRVRIPRSRFLTEVEKSPAAKSSTDIIRFDMKLTTTDSSEMLDYVSYMAETSTESLLTASLQKELRSSTITLVKSANFIIYNTCQITLLDIRDPGLVCLKVSSHRLHVKKQGLSQKDMHIWFPMPMLNPSASAAYIRERQAIVVSILSVH